MPGESRKWMIIVATIWIQAFTGTNFDFSSYSSRLKSVLGISQVQLNYLSVASDMGKAFGWCSGVSLLHFPLWVVLYMATSMGLIGYGLQWLLIKQRIVMPYFQVFLLSLLAGSSICWFNTVCYVLCIRNFPTNLPLALSLTISFNGVSAALYTLIANAFIPEDDTLYLFLNAIVPLFTSTLALVPILRQKPSKQQLSTDEVRSESFIFLILYILAVITGLYLLLLNSLSSSALRARILFAGAVILLSLPLCLPGITWARKWDYRISPTSFSFDSSSFNSVDVNDLQLNKELIEFKEGNALNDGSHSVINKGCFGSMMDTDRLTMLGEEHPVRLMLHKLDFWLYYLAYFCGGTIGLVYSNNLGQIAQSLGYHSQLNALITLYSTSSFFGRLLSAAPEFLHDKVSFARTGWLAVAVVPTPIAFILLAASGSKVILYAATALIGLSSGFIFSAAVSITSELFGQNNAGINHNIIITNIPIGSLLYGLLAALVYDDNAQSSSQETILGEASLCMGRQCFQKTFIWWACITLVGLFSTFLLYLRTRPAYDHFERNRNQTQFS